VIRKIAFISILLLVITCVSLGCSPTAKIKSIVIREHYVNVGIVNDSSIRINQVTIDGNVIPSEQLTYDDVNNAWVAKVSFHKTPHIEAWLEDNIEKARVEYEDLSFDYEVWAYKKIKEGSVFDPRTQKKRLEWEQKIQDAERELNRWDTLYNTGLSTNWVDELKRYVKIEATNIEQSN